MLLVTILVLITNNTMNAQYNYVPNGSFEVHKDTSYPIAITQNEGRDGYYYKFGTNKSDLGNELMRCINFCQSPPPFPYPPDECFIENGYFWPTYGSPDYFHRKGYFICYYCDNAQVPHPRMEVWKYNDYLKPLSDPERDSAYIGIGMGIPKLYTYSEEFTASKEYVQVKLNEPLVGGGTYKVRFFVSSSINNFYLSEYNHLFLSQICAFFSSDTIVVNRPSPPYPINQEIWVKNLAYNTPYDQEIDYVHISGNEPHPECAICSNTSLNAIGSWQEITGILYVPPDSTYRYMTIGNFQNDKEIIKDFKVNKPSLPDTFNQGLQKNLPAYYYIDNISVEDMFALPDTCCYSKFKITSTYTSKSLYHSYVTPKLDSLQDSCCYDYHFFWPNNSSLCEISRFEIVRNDTVFYSGEPDIGDFFPRGQMITRSYCMAKYPTSLNKFVLRYYTKKDGKEYRLYECTDTILINCGCNCSDIEEDVTHGNRWEFKLVPVPDMPNACCWDLVLKAQYYEMSNMCELDLSNKFLLFKADNDYSLENYNISSDTFIAHNEETKKYWQAPSDFKIIPGSEPIVIGRICSNGYAPDMIRVNFYLSETIDNDTCSKITGAQYLECKTPDTTNCCDLLHIEVMEKPWSSDSDIELTSTIEPPPPSPGVYCYYSLSLKIDHTPVPCFWDDSLKISLYLGGPFTPFHLGEYKVYLPDVFTGYSIPLGDFRLRVEEHANICVTLTNSTDTCIVCEILYCNNPFPKINIPGNETNIQTSTDSISITITPNPAEHSICISFYSETEQPCIITLSNELLQGSI